MPTPSGSYPVPAGAVAPQVAVPPPEYGVGQREAAADRLAPARLGITMLGGAEIEETRAREGQRGAEVPEVPRAAVRGARAPFKYGADKVGRRPRARARRCRATTASRGPSSQTARRADRLRDRAPPGHGARARAARSARAPRPRRARPAPGRRPERDGSSFADELAALRARARRRERAAARRRHRARAPRPVASPRHRRVVGPRRRAAAPTGQVDRDGDGRTDHWITRENGAIAREAFDENFDGKPDRTLIYDPGSHEVVSIEEDANFDGSSDAWTALRGGQVVGRRVDANGDGQVDSWSLYRGGVITRLERDTNGDGFRDHVADYQDGRLAREERDDDGDGRTDLISYFDGGEQRRARRGGLERRRRDGRRLALRGRPARAPRGARRLRARLGPAQRDGASSSAAHAGPGLRVPVRAVARALGLSPFGARGEERGAGSPISRRRCTAA